jgi:flagellar biosynthesis protein FlhG
VNRFASSERHGAHVTGDRPQLVSVLSGKGGVGKSILAFNLAERAAELGYLTLLVDADCACGNLHVLANVDPGGGFEKFASEQSAVADLVVSFNESLKLLPRSSYGPIESLSSISQIARCAARLRKDAAGYDLVVIDHGSGINPVATVFAGASDANLLIMVPELTSISDCYGLYKYLRQTDRAIDCRVVLNRMESDAEAEYLWARFAAVIEQFMGETPRRAGQIVEDDAVRRSVAEQRPISGIDPESLVLQALDKIIRDLSSGSVVATANNQSKTINVLTAPADIRE